MSFILTEEEEQEGQRKKQKRKNTNLGMRGMFSNLSVLQRESEEGI